MTSGPLPVDRVPPDDGSLCSLRMNVWATRAARVVRFAWYVVAMGLPYGPITTTISGQRIACKQTVQCPSGSGLVGTVSVHHSWVCR
jgi:hypothetical protein